MTILTAAASVHSLLTRVLLVCMLALLIKTSLPVYWCICQFVEVPVWRVGIAVAKIAEQASANLQDDVD